MGLVRKQQQQQRKEKDRKKLSVTKIVVGDDRVVSVSPKRLKNRYELRSLRSRSRNKIPENEGISSNDSKHQALKHDSQSLTNMPMKLSTSPVNNNTAKRVQAMIRGYLNKEGTTNNILTKNDDNILADVDTITRGNWSLLEGLIHVASVHNGILLPIIEKNGPPSFYFSDMRNTAPCRHDGNGKIKRMPNLLNSDGCESFRILCRIISGQQLAGAAAKTVWSRLLETVGGTVDNTSLLTPEKILTIASKGEDEIENSLRKPAGLSKSKAKSMIDLARHFETGNLSDSFLFGTMNSDIKDETGSKHMSDSSIRERLLQVKGIGPWSCDMFLLFHNQRPDVLPLGDLGVRKGTTLLFNVKGTGKNGILCEKKDASLLSQLHEPFAPYRSLSTFYMWKCADTKAFNEEK